MGSLGTCKVLLKVNLKRFSSIVFNIFHYFIFSYSTVQFNGLCKSIQRKTKYWNVRVGAQSCEFYDSNNPKPSLYKNYIVN